MELLIFFMILILLCHPLVLSVVTYTWLTIKGLLLLALKLFSILFEKLNIKLY